MPSSIAQQAKRNFEQKQSQMRNAYESGGPEAVKDLFRSMGFQDGEELERQLGVYMPADLKQLMELDAMNAQNQAQSNKAIEQQNRFLESVLPNSEIQPQSVADRRLEEYLFSSREGATIDDKGNMTNKGTLYPGLNIPQGTLPTPMSTISPQIDPGTRDQMAFMQQARPGAEGNFGAATPTRQSNAGFQTASNGAYYGGQLAPPPPEGYQTGSLLGRQNNSNQLQGQTQSGQSGYGTTNYLSSPNK